MKLCRFRVYKSIMQHVYIASWAQHAKPNLFLSPCIGSPLPLLSPSPLVTTTLLSVSVSYSLFFVLFVRLLLSVSYPTYEWNHVVPAFCVLLTSLSRILGYSQGPFLLLQVTAFHLFWWLSSIPLYICTTASLSNHLPRNTLVVSNRKPPNQMGEDVCKQQLQQGVNIQNI